jgi:hypothetical protein
MDELTNPKADSTDKAKGEDAHGPVIRGCVFEGDQRWIFIDAREPGAYGMVSGNSGGGSEVG